MVKHSWSPDGSNIPKLEPHTRAKHLIIEKYIENLIITLYSKGRYGERTFTFVDGFSGGGIYQNENSDWFGSPVILIKSALSGYQKHKREYPIDLNFVFIDEKQDHINCLKNYALPKAGLEEVALSDQCEFIVGSFEEFVDYCIFKVQRRKGHSFFLLDPTGWTDVSMRSIRKITALSGSEILYTFMIDPIVRFIDQREDTLKSNFENILEAEDYYRNITSDQMNTIGTQCQVRNETMRLFREKGKAKHAFTFSVIPRGDIRVLYYLVHLSNNLTALEVMKDSFWQEKNLDFYYHYEIYGFVFRTSEFYEENQMDLLFDIGKSDEDFCIENLGVDLNQIIWSNSDGITFKDIRLETMEKNPARRDHYIKYINNLLSEGEIEIYRKGKKMKNKKVSLQRGDVIKLSESKQLFIF